MVVLVMKSPKLPPLFCLHPIMLMTPPSAQTQGAALLEIEKLGTPGNE